MDKQEIIKNCIFGLAVGDALGVPYEFMRRDQTQAVDLTNMKSYGYFHKQPAGAWSDDTAMTLASMDSITRSRGFAPDNMMAAFQDWYQNGAYPPPEKHSELAEQSIMLYGRRRTYYQLYNAVKRGSTITEMVR